MCMSDVCIPVYTCICLMYVCIAHQTATAAVGVAQHTVMYFACLVFGCRVGWWSNVSGFAVIVLIASTTGTVSG